MITFSNFLFRMKFYWIWFVFIIRFFYASATCKYRKCSVDWHYVSSFPSTSIAHVQLPHSTTTWASTSRVSPKAFSYLSIITHHGRWLTKKKKLARKQTRAKVWKSPCTAWNVICGRQPSLSTTHFVKSIHWYSFNIAVIINDGIILRNQLFNIGLADSAEARMSGHRYMLGPIWSRTKEVGDTPSSQNYKLNAGYCKNLLIF